MPLLCGIMKKTSMDGEGSTVYQIAVCDDEQAALQQNVRLSERIMDQAGIPCAITAYGSSRLLLTEIRGGKHFDLLLLDVLMGELDGMALAAALRKQPDDPDVVFISTDRDMAMQGYHVEAKRYLLKPLKPELLREALLYCYGEAQRRLKGREQLLFPTAGGQIRVSLRDIRYAESWGRGTRLSLPTGQAEVRMRLSELASKLPEQFIHCHRTILVNLDYVSGIRQGALELRGGGSLPVSRHRMAEVQGRLLDHLKR